MSSRSFRVGRSVTGLGLFATKLIKRGAYIATYRGRRITTEEADRRAARGASYMFEVNKRWTIDGSPRWNVARYINHSCQPNAEPVLRMSVLDPKRTFGPEDCCRAN
jgi:SET domain-containing protein